MAQNSNSTPEQILIMKIIFNEAEKRDRNENLINDSPTQSTIIIVIDLNEKCKKRRKMKKKFNSYIHIQYRVYTYHVMVGVRVFRVR